MTPLAVTPRGLRPRGLPLTWLYAPGDRPEVVQKALSSGADIVIVDLEDAVAPHRKAYALEATAELLTSPQPVPVHVRIHAERDITALAPLPGLSALRIPKVAHATDIRGPAKLAPGTELYALLESAGGVEHAYAIATADPAVRGIALGEADLRADLGVRNDTGLDWPRSRIVVAARAAGLAPPTQSVYPDIRDLDGLAASCAHGRALGFMGDGGGGGHRCGSRRGRRRGGDAEEQSGHDGSDSAERAQTETCRSHGDLHGRGLAGNFPNCFWIAASHRASQGS
ncbi:HpcH/HpaI aldolase/citrate lyase family protein [Streptomyces sp. NPDC054841]